MIACMWSATVSAGEEKWFEWWNPFDEKNNQWLKDIDPNVDGIQDAHSGLVGFWNDEVPEDPVYDFDLAPLINAAFLGGANAILGFDPCYSGGMIDELFFLPAPFFRNISSSARHSECSRGPLAPPDGVGRDWVNGYYEGIRDLTYSREWVAKAAEDDPWGPNPTPPSGREDERQNTEHPQYWRAPEFGDSLWIIPDSLCDIDYCNLVIIWAGKPSISDRDQLVEFIWTLIETQGVDPKNIHVFYGSGSLNPPHAFNGEFISQGDSIQIYRAGLAHLNGLFAAQYGPGNPNPRDLLFFAVGHGFSTNPILRRGGGRAAGQSADGATGGWGAPDGDAQDTDGDIGHGGDPPFDIQGTPPELGACCLDQGLCTRTTVEDCLEMEGVHGGVGTVCAYEAPDTNAILDPFSGPCLIWGFEPNRDFEYFYSLMENDEFRIQEMIPYVEDEDWPLARMFRRINPPDFWEAHLNLDWEHNTNQEMMHASFALTDSMGNIIAEVGVADSSGDASPQAFAKIQGSEAVQGATFNNSDEAILVFDVFKSSESSWFVRLLVDGAVLHTGYIETEGSHLEIHVARSSDADVPFGNVSLRNAAFGAQPSSDIDPGVLAEALEFRLYEAAPNPFYSGGTIRYDLPVATRVRLSIYDVSGRRLSTLVDGEEAAGRHIVTWNGLDDGGDKVSSGVYFYRLEAGSFQETRRFVLIR
jgi:hypothetical protein